MPIDKSLLVRLIGFPATLIHGNPLTLDRWLWLRRRLPVTRNGEKLIDIGCGSGAFTIGAALRGFEAVGVSWDERNQQVALERARICGATKASFPIQDVRYLNERTEFREQFDIAICLENLEHILDDRKLMKDMFECLKPGGILFLTTPNYFYKAVLPSDNGPFSQVEDGGHVRRGYFAAMLVELCDESGFIVEEISSCSGFFSQKIDALLRLIRPPLLAWALTLPLRILPPLFDSIIGKLSGWPDFSICLIAFKPRFMRSSLAGSGQRAITKLPA
jgi:SAM-dependent methyltransferase